MARRTFSVQTVRKSSQNGNLCCFRVEFDYTGLLANSSDTGCTEIIDSGMQERAVPGDDGSISRQRLDCNPVSQFRYDRIDSRHTSMNMLVNGSLDSTCFECFGVISPNDRISLHLREQVV